MTEDRLWRWTFTAAVAGLAAFLPAVAAGLIFGGPSPALTTYVALGPHALVLLFTFVVAGDPTAPRRPWIVAAALALAAATGASVLAVTAGVSLEAMAVVASVPAAALLLALASHQRRIRSRALPRPGLVVVDGPYLIPTR